MYCTGCGEIIPEERLEAIPGATKCVKCSTTQSYVGFQVFGHKTAGECNIVNPNASNGSEVLRQAKRANKRSR